MIPAKSPAYPIIFRQRSWNCVIDPIFESFVTDNVAELSPSDAPAFPPLKEVVDGEPYQGDLEAMFDPIMIELPVGDVWEDYDIIGAIDTEYGQDLLCEDPERHNFLISIQLAILVRRGSRWVYHEAFLMPDGKRLTLARIVGMVLDTVQYPRSGTPRMLLVAHYLVAEWSVLADRDDHKDSLSAIGRTVVTMKPIEVKAMRAHRNQTDVELTLRDTILLTPGRAGLAKASEMTAIHKITLSELYKGRSLDLLYHWTGIFFSYAMFDVRACLAFLTTIGNRVKGISGVGKLPLTLGGMSLAGFKNWLKTDGYGYGQYHGNPHAKKDKEAQLKTLPRLISEAVAISCFHGGRNYANCHDRMVLPIHQGIVDFDLAGAYSAAMGTLAAVDLSIPPERIRELQELIDFHDQHRHELYQPIAMGEVEFEFPAHAEPCLPVSTDAGLLYPLTGISQCGMPEVMLALSRGAIIKLRAFYKWTNLTDAQGRVVPAFATYLSQLVQERDKHPKGSAENQLLKECINSLYGKLAQGSKHRTVRDLQGQRHELPESAVTNVVYAAAITSLVRTVLCALEECMSSVGARILAATTDGAMGVFEVGDNSCLTVKPMPDFRQILPGFYAALDKHPIVQKIKQGRINLGQDPEGWLEPKHVGDTYGVFRTRGYWLALRGKATFIAKGGHKIDGKPDEIMDTMEELFDAADPGSLSYKRLVSVFNIADGDADDLINTDECRRTNFDWDWKRDLLPDGSSVPFHTVGDVVKHREAAKSIRMTGKRADRTSVKLRAAGVKVQGGSRETIRRMLLRAIVRRDGGWVYPYDWSYRVLANRLGVKEQDIKNAAHREYRPQTLPRGPVFEAVARDLCDGIGIALTDAMRDLVCLPK